jgi:hypothetical protein
MEMGDVDYRVEGWERDIGSEVTCGEWVWQ